MFDSAGTYTVAWDAATLAAWQAATFSGASVVTNAGLLVQNGAVTIRSVDATPYTYRINGDVDVDTNGTLNLGGVGTPMVLQSTNTSVSNGSAVNVTGTGSRLSSGDLFVGYFGTGTLGIRNGGAVTNAGGVLGLQFGSSGTATVDGANSTWTNSSALYVGGVGTGTLNIRNGGTVSNSLAFLGYSAPNADGTATVDGANSTWTNSSALYVGNSGDGRLNI